MIIQGKRDAVYDGVYGGFSAPEFAPAARRETPAAPPWPPAPAARPRRRISLAAGGALAAVALGVAFGWMGRPDLATRAPARPTPRPTPAAAAPGAAELTPSPIAAAPPAIRTAPQPVEERFIPPPPPPLPKVERAKAPAPPARRLAPERTPAVAARPAFHCDWTLRPSERMVCNDAELAALDNRLNRAFSAAVRAGVPRPVLRAEQDRWVLVNRERAAAHSRWAVEDLYRERIAELEDLARGP